MWQAISRLLSEQVGEGEIELRNELPGGEVHAAWHLRYSGHDFFVKCDEREMLRGLPLKPISWSCSPAVKPLLCLRYGR